MTEKEMRLTSEFPVFKGAAGMAVKDIEEKFGLEVIHYDSEPTWPYNHKPSPELKVQMGNYIKVRGDLSKVCRFSSFDLNA